MSSSRNAFAKQLRRNMTDAESLLWYHLRGHRLCGMKFKRQQPLGDYIVDFVSFEKRLVIEVDGGQHLESEADKVRDAWLEGQGFRILRFWNNEVLGEAETVLERILQEISPSPPPLSREGRGEKSLERVRWRCRRGLLELDIVLGRFVEQRYASLDEAQLVAFDALLDMPDTVLWDMITGREAPTQEGLRTVLEWLKAA
ncbi:MAG: succinate dehydrogenase assembly factor 2 [Nitrosomonadales bacterium]|nr:succinate dehydrogenase assembly factor 2 [Nitrosomonadales bacterium]